jgi:hypothetical protein|tara:strand:- start:980 stop:1105 length:126 start_codon:yes stop_codon:yes gene_type:complete
METLGATILLDRHVLHAIHEKLWGLVTPAEILFVVLALDLN